MAEVLIVIAREVRELTHLLRRQRPVRNVDAQHVGVQLQVQAVHEAERSELILRQLAREAPLHLPPKLRDSLVDEARIEFIVAVHLSIPSYSTRLGRQTSVRSVRIVGPNARIASRIAVGRGLPSLTSTSISCGSMTWHCNSCCFATAIHRVASASVSINAPAAMAMSQPSFGAKNTTAPS